MTHKPILRGMANVSFWAEDLKAAQEWYTKLLGVEPYFQRPDAENPAYIEYRIGDYQDELGLIDKKYAPKAASSGLGGAILYWHVDDVAEMLEKLKEMGATEYEPLTPRGDAGWVTASVVDPFGNIIGLIHSPHYLETWKSIKKA
jgi:predicted enzyme related to lactoylglutathione lyase